MELTKKEQELVKKQDFRDLCLNVEQKLLDLPESVSGEDLEKIMPTKSTFADGCYIREIFVPAGQFFTTEIHKKDHPFFLLKGKLSMVSEHGVLNIEAPYHGITKKGTKRLVQIHEDVVFITVHATDKTTVEEVRKDVLAESFDDPAVFLKQ
jgi:hypothetical protein|tara:strand:- start:4855 stop:5310 length:456 start_codon:yes stop_codon:yes gene_type:complete